MALHVIPVGTIGTQGGKSRCLFYITQQRHEAPGEHVGGKGRGLWHIRQDLMEQVPDESGWKLIAHMRTDPQVIGQAE